MYKESYIHTNEVAINLASRENTKVSTNIFFVHGFLERWQSWIQVMDLIPKIYNVFSVDLRGFGRSGRTLDSHMRSTWAKDISKVIKVLELQNIFSMFLFLKRKFFFQIIYPSYTVRQKNTSTHGEKSFEYWRTPFHIR